MNVNATATKKLLSYQLNLTIVANKCESHIKWVQLLETSCTSFVYVEYCLNISIQ